MDKIISHADLIYRIVRLKPSYVIIDTEIARNTEPVITLTSEDNRVEHNTIRGDGMAGIPSKAALNLLLNTYKIKYRYFDWNSFGITNWDELGDYKSHSRISIIGVLQENS
jgi:hypothetical protein